VPIAAIQNQHDRYTAALKRELAAAGNVEAMMWMGDYLGASLTPADHAEAARFYTEAARARKRRGDVSVGRI